MIPDDQHHCCSACDKDGHCTHGLLTTWYEGYDRGVRNTLEVAKAEHAEQLDVPQRHTPESTLT